LFTFTGEWNNNTIMLNTAGAALLNRGRRARFLEPPLRAADLEI
jgi:hypothetical protein